MVDTQKMNKDPKSLKISLTPRVMIEHVAPEIDGGQFPIKRIVGENVVVRANVFTDGHEDMSVVLLYKPVSERQWREVEMLRQGNDLWKGIFRIEKEEKYFYSVCGYINEFITWRNALEKRVEAGQDVSVELKIGINILEETFKRTDDEQRREQLKTFLERLIVAEDNKTAFEIVMDPELENIVHRNVDKNIVVKYGKDLVVNVERKKALFSSWYEFFPRSWGEGTKHGTFKDCEKILPEIARMGFDVIYLPPIHPIGETKRKGKNNSVKCEKDDPGCPWAIGSKEGGHKTIHPELGTLDDFKRFIAHAKKQGLEVALDLAYQCSPDHPYVKEHPQWFKWRPDGTVQFAENPPKKYEDVLPINFQTEDWKNLWDELKSIVLFWIKQGVRVFRVDNPHTKPFLFWDWLIDEIRQDYPEVIFLAEAFTRPHVMYRLAKGGFSQSYTYFTWRNTKKEFTEYLTELTTTEVAEYCRPNFWPNTPDILPEHLQYGGRPAFIMRAVLASTLSSNFGIYGPAFELCVADAVANKEEYLNSEKYEIKEWDWDNPGHLKEVLTRLNKIRKENPCLQMTRNIRFCDINNDYLLAYFKATPDFSNIILVVVNLDPYHTQTGWLKIPIEQLGIEPARPYLAHDVLSADKFIWQGDSNYIELNPEVSPAHILKISRHLHREQDFDYFM